jgi:hypothetical protein
MRIRGQVSGLLGFTRVDLSVPPFAFAGLGAGFLSAMGVMAFGYASRPMHSYDLLRYSSMMMFLPTFVVALLQRSWASLPLWFCTALLIVEGLLRHERGSFGVEVFAVVLLTELARLIRGRRSELAGWRQYGMYGPPPYCKRKVKIAVGSAQMYPVFE